MKKRVLVGVVLCAVLAGVWFAFGRTPDGAPAGHARRAGGSPLSVEIARVAARDMPIRLEAVGQVESQHVVKVRPQVTGVLNKVAFAEGDEVKAGQLLFQIDPAPFKAALAQAKAALARDQATLAKAKWQRQRTERLAKRNYVTPQDLEDAQAAAKVAAAAV
ncbi:MAG TPA: efflux RND transporter periplasmic adaptor subunit, partial [Gammaproteobacteria bacterium]|nr:efflux RND transporter periplasmic adaptor subunit [Gammaproteobacteria bacterium]